METTKMNVTKDALRVLFFLLLSFCTGIVVTAQEVCSNTEELDDLRSAYSEEEVRAFMRARYGDSLIDIPSPGAYANLIPNNLNETFREPNFGYEIKLVGRNIQQLNSERNHWNADQTKAFFKTHSWKLSIFNGSTGEFQSEQEFSFSQFPQGSKCMDAIRWHPSDPNVLVYPRNHQLWGRNILTKTDFLIESFNHGNLGRGGRRLAGGDGNDYADDNHRLLLSGGDKHTNIMAYDFQHRGIARTVLRGNPGSYYHDVEIVPIQAGKKEPAWNLPYNIDFATISVSGKYIVALVEGQGTLLYDLNGVLLGTLYEVTPHIDVVYFRHDGKLLEGLVVKQVGAKAQLYGRNPGDLDIICWDVTTDPQTGERTMERLVFPLLDWLNQYGPPGGGQFSATTNDGSAMLAALNPAKAVGAEEHGIYFDEIVELSLNDDDPAPRRFGHHMVSIISPTTKQTEAWSHPNGRMMFFKSHIYGELPGGDEYLFFVDLKRRTCKDARDAFFSGGTIDPDPDPEPDPDPDPDPDPQPCSAPADWNSQDIGAVGVAGEVCDSAGIMTVSGAGWDIWKNNDAFHFVYQVMSGDGELIARVNSVEYIDEYTKAGVMMRESLSPESQNALMYISPAGRWTFQRRNVKSGSTVSTKSNAGAVSTPHWVRIVRSGNEVSGYHSPDGNNWTLADVDFIPMSTDIYVGLAVSSHDDTQLATASFEHVSFGGSGFSFPVEFLDFNATPDPENNWVELNWATASEENNSHFVVERSRDGAIFEPIGQVAGVGNSTFVNEYQYYDESPIEGKAVYRLKQIDLGGAFSFSEQVEVTFESRKIGHLLAYPNPASRGMQLSVEYTLPTAYSANIQLVSIDGRVVWNQLQMLEGTGTNRFDVPTDRLLPGIYLLSIQNTSDAEQVISKRIVINR